MSKKRTATVQSRPGSSKRSTPPGRRPPTIRRSGLPGWVLPVGMTVVALVVIFVALLLYSRSGGPTPAGSSSSSSGLPAPAATGQTVDGIQCQTSEQVLFHIHAHLAIFGPSGDPVTVPMGIGIPSPQTQNTTDGPFVVSGSCFYWLHSHATDGIIHVESPVQRTYTLGDYFDIWGAPLSPTQVGSDKGTVTAYVNGQLFTGNPRDIPLTAHAVIQLDVGSSVAPKPYTFAEGL
jgi:hypothetical protein